MHYHHSTKIGLSPCRSEKGRCPYGGSVKEKPAPKPRGAARFESEEAYQQHKREKNNAARKAWRQRQRDLAATQHLPREDKVAASSLSKALPDEDLDALYDAFYARKHEARARQLQEEWQEACRRGKRPDLGDASRMEGVARRARGLRNPARRKAYRPWAPRLLGRKGRLAWAFAKWFFQLYPRAMAAAVGKPSDWLA